MLKEDLRYILLKEDLSYIMENYSELTQNQERMYPIRGKRRFKRDQFQSKDKSEIKVLRLLREDGWDGEPVITGKKGISSVSAAQKIWEYGKEGRHIFLTARDLIRIGVFFHIGFYRTLALALKGVWEEWYAREGGWPKHKLTVSLEHLLCNWKRDSYNNSYIYSERFKPDIDQLYKLMEEHGGQATVAGYDQEGFSLLVREMLNLKLHMMDTKSKDLQRFALTEIKNIEDRKHGTSDEQKEYWLLKTRWVELWEEISELLLLIESRRLQNEKINQKWLKVFGELYFELLKILKKKENLEKRIELKEEDETLTKAQLDGKVHQLEEESMKELNELKEKIIWSKVTQISFIETHMNSEQASAYRQECKRVLKELFYLLHPDCLIHNPAYPKLTEEQKEYIKDLWHKIMKIRNRELAIPEGQDRSLEVLQDILVYAKAVLENAGLSVNVELIVQGETIKEQIEWLCKEMERLELRITILKEELNSLVNNEDIIKISGIMAFPEKHEEIKKSLSGDIEAYHKEICELEEKLENLFR